MPWQNLSTMTDDDLRAIFADSIHLDMWRIGRHDDDGPNPQEPCGPGHSLRVVPA